MPYINVDEAYILDNTGLQVDQVVDIPYTDAALTDGQKAQARKNIAAGGTNPNLADNPFFTIRQRGDGPFTTGNAFTVDRWKMNTWNSTSPTLTVNANGSVTLSSSTASGTATSFALWQIIENGTKFAGKTVTLSVMVDAVTGSGVKMFICGAANETRYAEAGISTGLNTLTFTLADSITGLSVYIGHHASSSGSGALSLTVSAVKLELGTVSTLANDTPPNYAEELAKCQYYFRRVSGDVYLCSGMAVSATAVVFPFPFTMRANPTITMTGTISAVGSGGILAVSSVNSVGRASNAIQVRLTVSGATQYGAYLLTPQNGAYIDFSADL